MTAKRRPPRWRWRLTPMLTPPAPTMESGPPPLFRQGPSAFARFVIFVALSLALLISDVQFKTTEIVREIIGAGLYPVQRAALVPRDLFMDLAGVVESGSALRSENAQLRAKNLQLSLEAGTESALSAENTHLRALLQLAPHLGAGATPAQIQYDTLDPFTQKIVIDHGTQQGIANGAPVLSEDGLIGQVTRVFPLQAEVSLVTDKDQTVPVQVVRTGLRSVIYGTPRGDLLDLRFVPLSADVVVGDELVTSGLDGVYPPGLPVAKVLRVDKQADTAFARIVCQPLAAVRGASQVLVLHYVAPVPPRPAAAVPASGTTGRGARAQARVPQVPTSAAPAPGTPPPGAPQGTPRSSP